MIMIKISKILNSLYCEFPKKFPILRVFTLVLFFSISAAAFADPADHGRLTDLEDDPTLNTTLNTFSIVIALILLIVIGGGILIVFLADYWKKNKDNILSFLGFAVIIGVVIFIGKCSSENRTNKTNNNPSYTPNQTYPNTQRPSNNYQQPVKQLRYRTEYYEGRCESCYGAGLMVCDRCNGNGYIEVVCSNCNGNGYKEVYRVVRQDLFNPDDKEYGWEYESCRQCFGKGKVKKACPKCDNDYPICNSLIKTFTTCSTCHGSGKVIKSRQVPYYE